MHKKTPPHPTSLQVYNRLANKLNQILCRLAIDFDDISCHLSCAQCNFQILKGVYTVIVTHLQSAIACTDPEGGGGPENHKLLYVSEA